MAGEVAVEMPGEVPGEVVVIGGGMAALCAALAVRAAGAPVRLLEQAPRALRGGNTRHSRNFRVCHDQPSAYAPDHYLSQEFSRDLAAIAEGAHDPVLVELLARRSAELVPWLAGHGVLYEPLSAGTLPYSRRTVFLLGGGKAAVNALYAAAEGLGVTLCYESEVTDLTLRQGVVERLSVRQGGRAMILSPAAVIAACGGYQANRAWLGETWGAAADNFIVRGMPYAAGTVLRRLLQQGALACGTPGACHLVAIDGRAPAEDSGIVSRIQGLAEGIVVDHQGRRRYDEAADLAATRYARWGQRLAHWPDQRGWLILDAAGQRRVTPSLWPPLTGASLAELAQALELPPLALEQTVEAFNGAIVPGSLGPEGGRTEGLEPPRARRAWPLSEPPFAAWPIRPGITFTGHGLRVDRQARVLWGTGQAARNLWAAGMIMAPGLIGTGYLSGTAITIGAVFGRLAGEGAAHHVLS